MSNRTGAREWRSWKTSPFGGPGALCGSGDAQGRLIVSGCARLGPKPESDPVAEAAGVGASSAEMPEVRRTNPPQPLGANTAKSLTTRARAAALRLIGQPASRGSPRGRTRRRSGDFRRRVGLDRTRFRLDPPGPGKSARLCRARSAGLSNGRSHSREGNPQGVDAVPSIACRRRISIRVFLTSVPRDGGGLPDRPP